jgi:hypothetical protein
MHFVIALLQVKIGSGVLIGLLKKPSMVDITSFQTFYMTNRPIIAPYEVYLSSVIHAEVFRESLSHLIGQKAVVSSSKPLRLLYNALQRV